MRRTGVAADLYLVDELPARLDDPVDLWLFQDSFEHIPDPAAFVAWMTASSAPNAEILLVAPRADSLSRRMMGRWWPHKLPDHQFHWSRAGLVAFRRYRNPNGLNFNTPMSAVLRNAFAHPSDSADPASYER